MGEISKQVRDYTGAAGFSILVRWVRKMDYPRASDWAARFGRLGYRLIGNHRRRSLKNLARVFGQDKAPHELESIAAAMFENFFRSAFECVAYSHLPAVEKKEYVQITGKEKLDEALGLDRGVIALTAHMGNFLILMTRLALEGYHVDLLVKKMKDKKVEQGLQNLRKDLNINTIYVNPKIQSARASLGALKSNHVLVLLGDQKQGKAGVDVTFFGIPAKAAAGPISLSIATGAPILPMFMIRNPDQITHTLVIESPLELTRTGSRKKNIEINVQKYTDVIQSYVHKYPDQWIWNHRRWARIF
jgi:KDO2-lipid IV(A) lauroyltransferase